ncbi:MAG: ATP-binding protein [Anaerolineales bacterium]
MALNFIFNLFSTLPGTVVYHTVVFLGLLAAAGIILTEWRQLQSAELKPYLFAIIGTLISHLLSVFLAPLQLQGGATLGTITVPLLYAGNLISVLLLSWAFATPLLEKNQQKVRNGLLIGWSLLLILFAALWYPRAFAEPLTYNFHSWQVPAWYLLTALAAFAGAGLVQRVENHGPVALIAFLLLGIGNLLSALGTPVLGFPWIQGEGLGRIFALIGYPLFAVELYRSSLADLVTYRQELLDLSQESLRQSQELLFLIEATRSIGEVLDLSGMLGKVADSVAMALGADTTAIFLVEEDDPTQITLAAFYQILGGAVETPQTIPLKKYEMLAFALRKHQLTFGPHEDLDPLRPLSDVLELRGTGPTLIQPLTHQERTMGLLVACNDSSNAAFTPAQQQLAISIAVQIAGAVENSRLYSALEAKAQELSDMLKIREAELRREDAILESMAEGILVIDARGEIILMNQATEEILGVGRHVLIGKNVQDLGEQLTSELELHTLIDLQEPLETTFDIDARKIRSHSAPVMLSHGERLGVVSILQDITREFMAEEAKREFIASISHELRTPLTAIKGYTEVMLSGMAGELPPAYNQFLGVIRENTTRMTSLTNNLISVAEIEQGRIGLNYRSIEIPELLEQVVKRHKEQLSDKNMELTYELTEELPPIEIDPNRVQLVLNNILSNAINFTYPNGEITIGCRSIQGMMGKPTFFSIWISDTGVGIPPAEQPLIWERFYRADNPLSLEAGGLGIGLTIAKALVEAHGGRVWVDSTVDKGSTFTVLLPIERRPTLEDELETKA